MNITVPLTADDQAWLDAGVARGEFLTLEEHEARMEALLASLKG